LSAPGKWAPSTLLRRGKKTASSPRKKKMKRGVDFQKKKKAIATPSQILVTETGRYSFRERGAPSPFHLGREDLLKA